MDGDSPITYYLDTSAIDRIYRDPKWDDRALEALLHVANVRFSALNIAELCATPDSERRHAYMQIVNKLSEDYRPLALPSDILDRSLALFEEARIAEERGSPPPDYTRNLSVEGDQSVFYALV